MERRNIVVAITGASGAVYAQSLLDKLRRLNNYVDQVAVIFSDQGRKVWEYELQAPVPENSYSNNDFFAPFASGSSVFDMLIVCPCSMGTLGRIANGVSDDLIARSADVMLKEKRALILVPREAPYNLIHLRNMQLATEAGAIICPASPSFYLHPATIADLVSTITDRVLKIARLPVDSKPWPNTG